MTARWAFAPVCGFDFWRVIVTSPEVLIFVFFMLTDPKTVPAGRVGRVAFGFLVAVASTLLMAPQTNEFGTKVALLGGLVVMCAVRPRRGPAASRSAVGGGRSPALRGPARHGDDGGTRVLGGVLRNGMIGLAVLVVGIGIVAAGTPARGVVTPGADDILGRVPHDIDPSTLPAISVEQDVLDWNHEITGPGVQEIVLTLAENLELENQAVLRADPAILDAVDHGDRLDEMHASDRDAAATGTTVVEHYQIDEVNVDPARPVRAADQPEPRASTPAGTVTEETYEGGRLTKRDLLAVREDVRAPPGDRRALAQRRRSAAGRRGLTLLRCNPRCAAIAARSRLVSPPSDSDWPAGAAGRRTRRRLRHTSSDDTTASGVDHRYTGDFQYFVGGGVAAFDCDEDGRADLFFAGGSGPAALYRNESTVGGALRFTRVDVAHHRLECGHRCLSARRRQRRPHRPRRPARRRGRHPARGWATAASSGQRGARPRRR